MRRHTICSLALWLGITLPGCKQPEAVAKADAAGPAAAPAGAEGDTFPPGPYRDRDLALAKQLVDGGALLLDVRSASEFDGGHIEGAVNITHTQINERIEEIRELQGGDPHKPIVLYCRSGHRAGLAKRDLEAAGFDRVTNFGGLADWPN